MHWPLWRIAVAERSMEPALRPGDWLLVLRTRRIRPGRLVVVRHPQRQTLLIVKRAVRRHGAGWWVVSDNPGAGAADSRIFGPVPGELIEGRVLLRYRRLRPLPSAAVLGRQAAASRRHITTEAHAISPRRPTPRSSGVGLRGAGCGGCRGLSLRRPPVPWTARRPP